MDPDPVLPVKQDLAPSLSQPKAEAAARGASYPEIALHPLFYPTRRPWEAPRPAAASSVPPAKVTYTLVGVIFNGDQRVALLRPSDGAKTIVVAQGQPLDGWLLRDITHERVRFERDGVSYELAFPPKESQEPGRAPK